MTMKHKLSGLSISKRQTLREEVYETIKRAILRGKLTSGERLVEEELASTLGISRTPVREAIHKLEKDGLVVQRPRGGVAVRQFCIEDIEEIFGIRSVLESHAAVLATRHITLGKMRILERKVERSKQYRAKGDTEGLIRLNTEFHDTLYKSARSRRLYDMISEFRDYFFRYRVAILDVNGMPDTSIQDHTHMLEAMRARNPAKVERLVRRHILRGKDVVLQQIRNGKLRL
jgi:DNA-binding GntR family transcriptional regulator